MNHPPTPFIAIWKGPEGERDALYSGDVPSAELAAVWTDITTRCGPPSETSTGTLYLYDVEGSRYFPLDMLRYDLAIVRHEVLPNSTRGHRQIQIAGTQPPTPDRWLSFGWKCGQPTKAT